MKQAVMFGAGNVGRGFIGQLFSEFGYAVTFVDVDDLLIETLAARGRYTIRLVDNENVQDVNVAPVTRAALDPPARRGGRGAGGVRNWQRRRSARASCLISPHWLRKASACALRPARRKP